MIKSKSEMSSEIEIDLTGPQGNAFVLMNYAKQLSKPMGLDGEAIVEEMMENDYDTLIEVFDKYFGEYVTLYR